MKEFRHSCGGELNIGESCPRCGEGCTCFTGHPPCSFCLSLKLNLPVKENPNANRRRSSHRLRFNLPDPRHGPPPQVIYTDAELAREIEVLRRAIGILEDKPQEIKVHFEPDICTLRDEVLLLRMLQLQRKVERAGKIVNFLRWRDGVNQHLEKKHG